jgi:hypothetical protein
VIVHSKTKSRITDAIKEHLVGEKFNTPGERGEMRLSALGDFAPGSTARKFRGFRRRKPHKLVRFPQKVI